MRTVFILILGLVAAHATAANVIEARGGIGSAGAVIELQSTSETATLTAVDATGKRIDARVMGEVGDKRVVRFEGLALTPQPLTLMLDNGSTETAVGQVVTLDPLAGLMRGDTAAGADLAKSIEAELPEKSRAELMGAVRRGVFRWLVFQARREALELEKEASLKAAREAAASVSEGADQ